MELNNQIEGMKRYPSLQKHASNMIEYVDEYVNQILRTQRSGNAKVYLDEVCNNYQRKYNEAIDPDLFREMLSERDEFSEVEEEYGKLFIEINEAYLSDEPYEITQKELNIISANHMLWKYNLGGEQADLSNCVLRGLNMVGMNLSDCECDNTEFYDCLMQNANFDYAHLESARFFDCDMRSICARRASLYRARFEDCDLTDSVFRDSILRDATVINCDTQNADTSGCNLRGFEQIGFDESSSMTM